MYLYVIFGLLSLLALWDVLLVPEKRPKGYGMVFFFVAFCLFVLSAFRYERGADWLAYEAYFRHCSVWDAESWMEPGYTWLNKVINVVARNYSLMVLVGSTIIYALKPRVIYLLAPFPFVALLAWYAISIADIFPVRQTIASAFILYSVIFIIRRQFVPFLIWVIVAATFHLTALIFVVAYFIFTVRLSSFWSLIVFVGSFVLAFMAQDIMVQILGSISNPIIQERLEHYLEQGADNTFGSAYSTSQVLLRGFLNRGIIMALVFGLLNRRRTDDVVFNGWVNLFIFSSAFFALLSTVNVALGRLVAYFDLSQIFIFSYIFTRNMNRPNRMLIYSILLLYMVYRFYGVVNNYYDLYVPYKGLFWNYDMAVELY